MIKVNIGAVILKNKDSDKPSEKCSWYEYSSPGTKCPKSCWRWSQQARDNTGFQEKCQSENQGSAENEDKNFIAESESMLQSYLLQQEELQLTVDILLTKSL